MHSETSKKPFSQSFQAPELIFGREAKLSALRKLIAATERRSIPRTISRGGEASKTPWCTGLSDVDANFPTYGLNRYGAHMFSGATYTDSTAASGFVLALIKQLADLSQSLSTAPILWCQTAQMHNELGAIHSAGLKSFGLDKHRFIFVHAQKNKDILWALEEGARSSSLLAVVGEVGAMSFTQSRRLSLAAAEGGTPVLLLRPHHGLSASAAETRWRIASAPSADDPFVSSIPGNPRWQIELVRCRSSKPGSWTVEWNNETHRFHLAQKLSSGPLQVADALIGTPKIHALRKQAPSA